jgi:hypothetical protein
MTHTLAHAVAANAERHVNDADDTVYVTAARAEATAKGEFGPGHRLCEPLVVARARQPWFRAAVDAAVTAEQTSTRRWRLEAERLRRLNLGALHLANRINPHAGCGHVAAELGNVRLTLASSREADRG